MFIAIFSRRGESVKRTQLRSFLSFIFLFSFLGPDLHADETLQADNRYLPVRNFQPSSRSTSSSSRGNSDAVLTERAGYGSPSLWALGISFTQNSALFSNADPMQMTPSSTTSNVSKDPDTFGLMETATVLNARAGYQLTDVASLYVNLGGSFQRGIMDPALGVAFRFPFSRQVSGILSLQGTLPLSSYSRDVSRITTLTGSAGPVYYASPSGGLFLGGIGFLSYSFYRSDSGTNGMPQNNMSGDMGGMSGNTGGMGKMAMGPMPTNQSSPMTMTGMDMNTREIMRSGGNAFLGYQFNPSIGVNTGAGISASYRDDDTTMWMLDVTVARATYSFDSLQASATFSLMSDHMKNEGMLGPPNLPFIGFRLQYVFGNEATLGGATNSSCHH